MTTIITPPCMVCGKTSEMEVDSLALHRWQTQGWLIQTAFPDMPAPEREQLKTGTHEMCWNQMFADEEDDEDDEDERDDDGYDPADQASYWRESWDEHDERL